MLNLVARRLMVAIPTLFIIIVLSFLIIKMAPGGPFDAEAEIDPEIFANLERAYYLDRPVWEQFWRYFTNLMQGDFGQSFVFRDRSVADIIVQGFPVSAQIGLWAIFIGAFGGIALGIVAALRKNTFVDYGVMTVAMTGIAVPTFVTAPTMALVFGLYLGLLPISGWNGGAVSNMILPIAALALPKIGVIARITRGGMLEVL